MWDRLRRACLDAYDRMIGDHPDPEDAFVEYAAILLLKGDAAAYRAWCARLAGRFGEAEGPFAGSMLARACGKTNVHSLEPEDLAALTVEAAAMARVPLAGTDYIPGVSEERSLNEIKRLRERHLENPIDYLVTEQERVGQP